MPNMPFGTTGGQLHRTFPTHGRYGGERVADRNAAREQAAAADEGSGQTVTDPAPNESTGES